MQPPYNEFDLTQQMTSQSSVAGTVTVDPRFKIPYFTFVLRGLSDLGVRVRLRRLDHPGGDGMAMLYDDRRIWADTNDRARIEPAPYEWADVLGKVNCTIEDALEFPKVRLLGPIFGTQLWKLPAGYLKLPTFVLHGATARATLAGLRFQGITRLPIESYHPGTSEQGYVFHRSRAWAGTVALKNRAREHFIHALSELPLHGEATITDERIPLSQYLHEVRRSSVVFNCPAVHGCLGWKLGEYLAMGKAIISTPLERALPVDLVHGEHIHFVDDHVDHIRGAIELIDRDQAYRRHLETGARAWYEENLSPAAVALRLLSPT